MITDKEYSDMLRMCNMQVRVSGYIYCGYKKVHKRKFPVLKGPKNGHFRYGKGLSRTYIGVNEFQPREAGTTRFSIIMWKKIKKKGVSTPRVFFSNQY